jgi:glycine/D-amino acid oxidase-like deaminating enzyme
MSSITERRDLRTGTPVWKVETPRDLSVEPLIVPSKADVVVVGAGITGALIAEAATARGLSVIVLDRRQPCHGSTAASTALLQFEIDTPLMELVDMIGHARASRAWMRSFRAVQDLAILVHRLSLHCDFRPRRALYLAGNLLGPIELVEEDRLRRAIGLPSTFLNSSDLRNLAGIIRPAALLSEGAADVNPVALTRGLLLRAKDRGARLYSPAELAEVVPRSHKVEMVTSAGIELEAKAIVFATGYELAAGVPAKGHRRSSTWAFSTRPQRQTTWGEGQLIWEAADPYLYIRTTADGRIMVGGEDEPIDDDATRDALLPTKVHALQTKAKRLLPWIDATEDFAWAGTFGESEDGLPSIGCLPDMPNCYAVLGYGGNGITFGVLAAQILVEALCGGNDPDANIFAFRS